MKPHIQYDPSTYTLIMLDQRLLPLTEQNAICTTSADVVRCIKDLTVRGAPAIGVAAAWGCVLAAVEAERHNDWRTFVAQSLADLACARPTAVNLSWAITQMRSLQHKSDPQSPKELYAVWLEEATRIHHEDIAINKAMGKHGAVLLADGDTVLTHCNAGALATAGYGTALGVIRAAIEAGKRIQVIADETRPVLQGARLTAYELHMDGIPVTVACDNAAGLLLRKGLVNKIIVGADRIAANGDTANKIGTYGVAVLAKEHGVPFYVAAPFSTIDPATPDGDAIPIEERSDEEVAALCGTRILPVGVRAYNFAFDVTPASLIHGIITEKGVLKPPYASAIANALQERE